ncbi:MAG: hypothetical protein U5K70_08315 [Halodesulfurarchaeum sp.]|nr:hypothetical protein [Halodesulfurarchaeum sp.]
MMRIRIGIVLVLVVLSGCAAPAPSGSPPSDQTTTGELTTAVPTPTVTTAEPEGVVGSIRSNVVENDVVYATIAVTNHGPNGTTVGIAIRYVENDSFAKVGDLTVGPGETETREVALPTYGDDPRNLTVQLRIEGSIVAERSAE